MRYLSMLVKPASAACDMACSYCFYRDLAQGRERGCRPVMDRPVMEAVVSRAFEAVPDGTVAFDFQGGEPTLAGLDFFEAFVAEVERRRGGCRVSYAIQTNGLALDERWCEFLGRNRFLVGVSLDGTRSLHDRLRPAADGGATWSRVAASLGRLRRHGVEPAVLCVLSSELARHPQQVYRGLASLGARHVQFIPCLGPAEGGDGSPRSAEMASHALTPERFAHFYRGFLDAWERGQAEDGPMAVGLFDDVMGLSLGRRPRTCGALGACAPQFVVESDGSVYPCDFYASDRWCMGNVCSDPIEAMAAGAVVEGFLSRPRRAGCDAPCADCGFEGICHGGCPRLSTAFAADGRCGYREFLEYGYGRLARRARERVGRMPWA